MPATPVFPGVYVEEIQNGQHIISAVDLSLPLFIGYTERQPDPSPKTPPGQAITLHNMQAFEQHFGAGPAWQTLTIAEQERLQRDVSKTQLLRSQFLLYESVRLFLRNSMSPCQVISVGQYQQCQDQAPDHDLLIRAIEQLKPGEYSLIAIPDAAASSQAEAVHLALLEYCSRQHNCFALLDLPMIERDAFSSAIKQYRNLMSGPHLHYGAAFIPWLEIEPASAATLSPQPLQDQRPLRAYLPPSGAIAAVLIESERMSGAWKQPERPIIGITGLQLALNSPLVAEASSSTDGVSLNTIRYFPSGGYRLWGNRTLAGHGAQWRYYTKVRTQGQISAAIVRYLAGLVMESNDEALWALVRQSVQSLLLSMMRQGAFPGTNAEQNYYVRIGLNQTMSRQDLLEGNMLLEVGIAFTRPGEFIVTHYRQAVAASEDSIS